MSKIKESDDFLWTPKPNQPNSLQYVDIHLSLKKTVCFNKIGGMDISFSPEDPDNACAYFAVLSYPKLKVESFLNPFNL